jgi:hypothetical protein
MMEKSKYHIENGQREARQYKLVRLYQDTAQRLKVLAAQNNLTMVEMAEKLVEEAEEAGGR